MQKLFSRLVLRRLNLTLGSGLVLAASPLVWGQDPAPRQPAPERSSETIAACSDFYQSVNGAWLASPTLPVDADLFSDTAQQALARLEAALPALATDTSSEPNQQKLGDLYRSYLDRDAREALGLTPLNAEFALIDALDSQDQLPVLLARLYHLGVRAPLWIKFEPTWQGTLSASIQHVGGRNVNSRLIKLDALRILRLSGNPDNAEAAATAIVRMSRAPQPTHAANSATRFDFTRFTQQLGISNPDSVIPSAETRVYMASLLDHSSIADWKHYLRWQLIRAYQPYLPQAYVQARNDGVWPKMMSTFTYAEARTRGIVIPESRARYAPALTLLLEALPDAVQQFYLQRVLAPVKLARAQQISRNLRATLDQRLATRTWLSPAGRELARQKLRATTVLLGRPQQWTDYRALPISAGTLIANIKQARDFNLQQQIQLLGTRSTPGPFMPQQWLYSPSEVSEMHFSTESQTLSIGPRALDTLLSGNLARDYGRLGTRIIEGLLQSLAHADYQFNAHSLPASGWTQASAPWQQAVLQFWLPNPDMAHYNRMAERQIGYAASYFRQHQQQEIERPRLMVPELAQVSSVEVALDALSREPELAGAHSSAEFFRAFAGAQRIKFSPQDERDHALTVGARWPRYEVNMPLSNMRQFAQTFACVSGDPMVRRPEQQIELW